MFGCKKHMEYNVSMEKAKKIAKKVNKNFDRCNEYTNYFMFYESSNVIKRIYVSKKDGKATETREISDDFFRYFLLHTYDLKTGKECEKISYRYYPDINAVAKSDGSTFFDTERGFIFDIDGDWICKGIFEGMRESVAVSSEKAFEIVTRDDYEFLFFDKKMSRDDIDYYVKMGMPYRLKI